MDVKQMDPCIYCEQPTMYHKTDTKIDRWGYSHRYGYIKNEGQYCLKCYQTEILFKINPNLGWYN